MPGLPGIGDLVRLLTAQAEALAALPEAISTLNRSLREVPATLVALQQLTRRVDAVVTELEEPVRMLAPGLRRLAVVLDNPALDDVPATFTRVRDDVLPVLRALAETQSKVAGIAATTDRLMGMVDDVGGLVAGLPGASLWGRRQARGAAPGRATAGGAPNPAGAADAADAARPPGAPGAPTSPAGAAAGTAAVPPAAAPPAAPGSTRRR